MKIVVLDGYTLNPGDNPWTEVERHGELTVHDRTDGSEIVERARDADVVLTNKTPLSAETLAELPNLKFIAVLATGFNVVDIAAARERGISVSNVPVYGTTNVGQFVMALLLGMCHHVSHHDARVRGGEWALRKDFCFWDFPLVELAGLTMGIVGFGRIGRRTGELAHAFGMKVATYEIAEIEPPGYEPFENMNSVEDLFAASDVISLHCPQTADNTGMINTALLSRMKPTAFLINTSRGGLVAEQDLADALAAGTLAGAAVDVVSAEPISPDNPLLKAPNCIITPHIAWATLAARMRLMQTTADNIAAFVQGSPTNVVN